MAPYAKLRSLPGAARFLKPGIDFTLLDAAAAAETDLEAARCVQAERRELFLRIGDGMTWRPRRRMRAGGTATGSRTVPEPHPGGQPPDPRPRRGAGIGGRECSPGNVRAEPAARLPPSADDRQSPPTGYLATGASTVRFAERDASGTVPDSTAVARNNRLANPKPLHASPSPLTRRQRPSGSQPPPFNRPTRST